MLRVLGMEGEDRQQGRQLGKDKKDATVGIFNFL
jgi:hypothetical protein